MNRAYYCSDASMSALQRSCFAAALRIFPTAAPQWSVIGILHPHHHPRHPRIQPDGVTLALANLTSGGVDGARDKVAFADQLYRITSDHGGLHLSSAHGR